jgi:hypothetical protein
LLDIDADEKKAQETVWKKRARLINSLPETYGDVCADVERIIGTADLE